MKAVFNEYLKIIMYVIFGILFITASYTIIINNQHYNSLSQTVVVSEADNDYSKYKDNVVLIEEKLKDNTGKNEQIYLALTRVLSSMKKNGVFRLIPKTKLSYQDLYTLNDYYLEELINNSWVNSITELDTEGKYGDTMTLLINNSKYLNSIFTSNGVILYDGQLDTKINDNYHFILDNYLMYSNVILDVCNDLGGSDV